MERLSRQTISCLQRKFDAQPAPSFTFAQMAWSMITRLGWSSDEFQRHTALSANTYSRIKNGMDCDWSLQTVIAVCYALGVSKADADMMLHAAGLAFGASYRNRVYASLFTEDELRGRSIRDIDVYLDAMGVPMLGT